MQMNSMQNGINIFAQQRCRAPSLATLAKMDLTIISLCISPPTHSFTPGLKPFFSANPSHCSPSFLLLKYSLHGFPGLFTVISEHICFLFVVFLFLHFLVVGLRAVD